VVKLEPMAIFFDSLETRSVDQRLNFYATALPNQIKKAQNLSGFKYLFGTDANSIKTIEDLVKIPILRKSDLIKKQKSSPPFGNLVSTPVDYYFYSPGPIYEPAKEYSDWWRFGRFLHAGGIGIGDIVQNCFSYHFTPAGMMFENGARAVGASVFPAGTGQTELQVQAALDIGVTAYAGTPDYLNIILDKAEEMGINLKYEKAVVSGGALFPSTRKSYIDRGISCLQCYGTADLGCIAYESSAIEGMIVEEGVIVEIVIPGTGTLVEVGQVGEVVVTTLNSDYPLIRFATGDMSALMPGLSSCGRTNVRIKGWMGRADQTTKIKGMFVRPEQVATLVERHSEVFRARVVVERLNGNDLMTVKLEARGIENKEYAQSIKDILRISGKIEVLPIGALPNDGLVIEDLRSYD